MTFSGDIDRHIANRKRRMKKVFVGVTEEVQRSVVEGSELTGAPGQPVQLGTLKGSWVGRFLDPTLWRLITKIVYAPVIEAGVGITIRSAVGGTHSVAKTRTGFKRIVDAVGRRYEDR